MSRQELFQGESAKAVLAAESGIEFRSSVVMSSQFFQITNLSVRVQRSHTLHA
jgi:hypothetical protein